MKLSFRLKAAEHNVLVKVIKTLGMAELLICLSPAPEDTDEAQLSPYEYLHSRATRDMVRCRIPSRHVSHRPISSKYDIGPRPIERTIPEMCDGWEERLGPAYKKPPVLDQVPRPDALIEPCTFYASS